jgi:type II secretory pathway pseudopilin PulG
MMNKMIRNRQRGSAMLVTMILIAALLAGVAVLVSLQLTSTKSTETTRTGLAALHCADAGLAASRVWVGSQETYVKANLGGTLPNLDAYFTAANPDRNDIDGDGVADFTVSVFASTDVSRVWLVSRCIKYPDAPKEVRELIEFSTSGTQYKWQEGGAFGNNNAN